MENKFDTGDLFMNGENHQDKTPLNDLKVTTPKNPLLSITRITSIRNLTKSFGLFENTNLQLNPYPIPNWTCIEIGRAHV